MLVTALVIGLAPSARAGDAPPLSTVRAIEGSGGDVAVALLASLGRTKRLGWEPTGPAASGAAFTGVVMDEVVASLRVEGAPHEQSESIAALERLSSPDPELQRPPLVSLTTPGAEFHGVIESLAYECATDHCDVHLALLQTAHPSVSVPEGPLKPAAASAPAPDPKSGYLTLDTYPWTRISENGRALGTTPLLRVPLAPGVHKLTLENRDLRIWQTYTVTIRSGEPASVRLGLR